MKVRFLLQDFILPAVIFACAFLVRYISLNRVPPPSWDEAVYIRSGQLFIHLISQRKFFDPQWWYDYDVPPVGCYLIGIALWFAGYRTPIPPPSPFPILQPAGIIETARMVDVVLSSLTCVNIFYLGRILRNTRIGLAATWIWVFDPLSIRLGRRAMLESIMGFFLTLSLLTFFQGVKKHDLRWIVVSGVFFGLAAGTKMFAWLEIPILAISIIFLWLGKSFSGAREKDSSPIRIHLHYLLICSVVGVTIFFVSWPFLWPNPVTRLLASFNATKQEHFALHFGSLFWVYILFRRFTVPEVALAIWGFVVALCNFLNRKTIFLESLATSWFILTLFFLTFFIKSENSWYIFNVTPSIAILASVGFNDITERFRIRQKPLFIAFLAGIVALHAVVVLRFYPFYLYDNLRRVLIGHSHVILGIFSLTVFIYLLVLFLVIPLFMPQ
jgi:4-amino-4-deoxy-L-arabinose transferase-like glycosyltransferase